MKGATLPEKVEKTIAAFGMEERLASVLVGFSGGADSVALLSYLHHRAKEKGTHVRALHVHHGIRGEAADADESFCRAFCEARGIPLTVVRADIPALAKAEGKGLEEAARDFRYRTFYEEMERDATLTAVATAHNADDNVETVLFHLARGTALKGLCGIPPVTPRGVIRPLLDCTKDEIIAYCEGNTMAYVTDETNADPTYTRNHIRHTAVKDLKVVNPELCAAVTRMCDALRRDEAALAAQADEAFAKIHGSETDRDTLLSLSDAVLYRVLERMYATVGGGTLSAVHFEDMATLLHSDQLDKDLSLPDGVIFSTAGRLVCFRREEKREPYCYPLSLGDHVFEDLGIRVCLSLEEKIPEKDENIYKLSTYRPVKFDTINGSVFIRSRQSGDRLRQNSMTKSVKRMLCDAHVPRWRRDSVPLFCDQNGIFYIRGLGLRDGMLPDGSGRTLHIYLFEKDPY